MIKEIEDVIPINKIIGHKKIIKYVCSNGRKFNTLAKAQEYEKYLNMIHHFEEEMTGVTFHAMYCDDNDIEYRLPKNKYDVQVIYEYYKDSGAKNAAKLLEIPILKWVWIVFSPDNLEVTWGISDKSPNEDMK